MVDRHDLRRGLRVPLGSGVSGFGDEQGGEAPVERPAGERGDRQRLDLAVIGLVVVLEGLVVRQVARGAQL